MKVCILRGPGAEQPTVDRAMAALQSRQVEAVEVQRDGTVTETARHVKNTSLLLTLGGDGTFLHGARIAAPRGIPVLGVNLGRLGFLTEIEADQLEEGLARFFDGSYRIEERTILKVVLMRGDRAVASLIGLNEVVVDHSGEVRMLRLEIDVGGQAVGVIDADGVIVATATGSTAYALASGGPILEPTLRDLVIVPMSPFALTVRPIVFPPGQDVTIKVIRGPAEIRVDGSRRGRVVEIGDIVRAGAHARRLKVVRFSPPESFYQRLADKLGWGKPLVPKK
jgi:NAD+ kinase